MQEIFGQAEQIRVRGPGPSPVHSIPLNDHLALAAAIYDSPKKANI